MRHPLNSHYRRSSLRKAQCRLKLRKIPTALKESPYPDAPKRAFSPSSHSRLPVDLRGGEIETRTVTTARPWEQTLATESHSGNTFLSIGRTGIRSGSASGTSQT